MAFGKRIYNKITRFIRIVAVFIIKILFSKSHFKVSIFDRIYFAFRGGFNADQIVLYDLKKKRNRKKYISEFEMHKSRFINEPYSFILNDKLVCTDVLKQYIKVPEIVCIKKKGFLLSSTEEIETYDDVFEVIEKYRSVYLKPISVGKGNGVFRIKLFRDKIYLDDDEVSKDKIIKILSSTKEWFLCVTIKQSKFLDNIYDKTSNTIRLITARNMKTGKVEVLSSVLRIGTSETIPVDNGSRGGLVSMIDLDTGKLSSAKSITKICNYEKHPDSGNQIEGLVIPNFKEIKKEFINLMKKFPYLYFIAWDILLTEDGPVVIEANASSGLNIIQVFGGQRNKEIGNFYRSHKVIK